MQQPYTCIAKVVVFYWAKMFVWNNNCLVIVLFIISACIYYIFYNNSAGTCGIDISPSLILRVTVYNFSICAYQKITFENFLLYLLLHDFYFLIYRNQESPLILHWCQLCWLKTPNPTTISWHCTNVAHYQFGQSMKICGP